MKRSAPMKQSAIARTPMKRAEPKPPKGPRPRKCKVCREPFIPRSMTHQACKTECAVTLGEQVKAAQDRKELRARKQAAKSRRDWEKEVQVAVNAWVRLVRDKDKACISCGRWHDGQWHCGHYLSRGARPNLRYEESNLAKQCAPCNVHLSGNQVNFRIGLVARIGLAAVEALESDDRARKYTVDELKAMKAHYTALLREGLKNNAEKIYP